MDPNLSTYQQQSSVALDNKLLSIRELFSKSWETFTKSILNLFILDVLSILSFILISLFAFGAVMLTGIGAVLLKLFQNIKGSNFDFTQLSNSYGVILLIIILFFLAVIVTSTAYHVSAIILVGKSDERPGFWNSLGAAFGLIFPLIVLGIISAFFEFGSFFLLFFPVLIVSYFFMFVPYEAILFGKRGRGALLSSVQIVGQHFGEILIRQLIFSGLSLLLVVFIPNLLKKLDSETWSLFSVFSFIFNMLVSWFGVAFSITLYKQARERTDFNKKTSQTWFWIIAVIGWLIAGLIGYARYKGISAVLKDGSLQKYLNSKYTKTTKGTENLSYLPSSCGFSMPIPSTKDGPVDKTRKWMYEEIPLNADNFYVLDKDFFSTPSALGALLQFKEEPVKLVDGKYSFAYPGLVMYCADNTKSFTLEEYKALALANKKYQVRNEKNVKWGEVELVPIWIQGERNGVKINQPSYLGVSQDKSRLIFIVIWGPDEKDKIKDKIDKDTNLIINSLKYRDLNQPVSEIIKSLEVSQAATQPQKTTKPQATCITYNIREGEFASDKCYS